MAQNFETSFTIFENLQIYKKKYSIRKQEIACAVAENLFSKSEGSNKGGTLPVLVFERPSQCPTGPSSHWMR